MSTSLKSRFLEEVARRFGSFKKLPKSESLFQLDGSSARLYFRYSKRHPGNRTFFGLRKIDLQALQGHPSVICFFWEGQRLPLFVPFSEFEEVFARLAPASDGQFKAQVFDSAGGLELYIANAGRFNAESYQGWEYLATLMSSSVDPIPQLSHSQVQTLLGGIGHTKGFDVWVPQPDRGKLDWSLTGRFHSKAGLPSELEPVAEIAQKIDVIWIERGSNRTVALYEVEHSTPIYSGLLRFNDVHLALPRASLRFGIVSNEDRRALFVRQLTRPTFLTSGLRDVCTFFEYRNVYIWHRGGLSQRRTDD